MHTTHITTYWKKILSGFLVCSFVIPLALGAFPEKTYAVLGNGDTVIEVGPSGVSNGVSAVKNTVTAVGTTINAAALKSLGIKEWSLDGVAWAIAKKLVSEIARSTTAWINTGFQGSPMYVTDLNGYLLNIADEAAGEVLYGSDLDFLCSPINVKLALGAYYRSMRNKNPLRCTLTSAVGNIQNFVSGNFASGGWPAWFSVSLNPINSNLGGTFAGQAAIITNIYDKQQKKMVQRSWGNGFLDSEQCTGEGAAKKCVTVTPGETISNALSFQLTTGQLSLIQANEINEMIGALAAQMVKQGLTAASGVFGLSQSGSGSSGYGSGNSYTPYSTNPATSGCAGLSYIDQMNTPACDPLQNTATSSSSLTGSGSIVAAEDDERAYQAMQQRVVNAADAIIFEAARRGQGCTINDSVTADATLVRSGASTNILSSEQRVQNLALIQTKYDTGTDEVKLATLTDFANMVSSGSLRTSMNNAEESSTVDQTVTNVQGWSTRIEDCPNTNTNTSSNNGGIN